MDLEFVKSNDWGPFWDLSSLQYFDCGVVLGIYPFRLESDAITQQLLNCVR